jgi:predicted nucleic acid-binding Zn ribbon protein
MKTQKQIRLEYGFAPGFIDHNTYVYRLNPDGSKGELKRVQEAPKLRLLEVKLIKCPVCGLEFAPLRGGGKTCSTACKKKYQKAQAKASYAKRQALKVAAAKKKKREKVCEVCGAVFEARTNGTRFCSPACRRVGKREATREWTRKQKEGAK